MTTTLSESIFLQLKTEIIRGSFPSGSKLPSERDLADRYDVSRVTIRDVVRKLEQMGLIEKVPQSGTYVCEFESEASLDLLVQIMQTREAVDGEMLLSLLEFRRLAEVFAARKAAQRITAESIGILEEILEGIEAHLSNTEYLSEADYRLHYAIAKMSGNLVIKLMFNSFKPIYHFYSAFFYALPDAGPDSLAYHHKLVAAIASGDGDRAARTMEEALLFAESRVIAALERSDPDGMFPLTRGLNPDGTP